MPRESSTIAFVRALVAGQRAIQDGESFVTTSSSGRRIALPVSAVAELRSAGVLGGHGPACHATAVAPTWLRRTMLEADGFAAQHRVETRNPSGTTINLAESPLGRLAAPGRDGSPPFLAPHHVEAGERLRRLVDRAQLQPRITMSYDPAHTPGSRSGTSDISDMAAEARRKVSAALMALPADCAGVIMDVCGLLKGLQVVESERGWPRRSAKLVLRIGLEQLAAHWGLLPVAAGPEDGRSRTWRGEGARPHVFD